MWSVPELGKKLALGVEIPSPIRGPTWMTRHVVDTRPFSTRTHTALCVPPVRTFPEGGEREVLS